MAKKSNSKKEEVAVIQEEQFDKSQLPAEYDLSKYAGAGQMNNAKYLAIPYLSVLGLQSAVCLEGTEKYIEGAKPGMFLETLNKKIWSGKEGVIVVPVLAKVVVSKLDGAITDGRSRIGKFDEFEGEKIKADCRQDGYRFYDQDGNYYEDELEYYLIIVDGKNRYKACLSMHGTRIKVGKTWNSLAAQKKIDGGRSAPLFVAKYKITSVLQQKDKNSWYNFEIEDAGPVLDSDLMREAIDFFNIIEGGEYEVAGEESEPTSKPKDI